MMTVCSRIIVKSLYDQCMHYLALGWWYFYFLIVSESFVLPRTEKMQIVLQKGVLQFPKAWNGGKNMWKERKRNRNERKREKQ